jgi:hypothetical protein
MFSCYGILGFYALLLQDTQGRYVLLLQNTGRDVFLQREHGCFDLLLQNRVILTQAVMFSCGKNVDILLSC